MSYHDPHTGHQIRAFRTDPTGRHNPINLEVDPEWYEPYLLGAAAAAVLAFGFWAVMP